VLRCSSRQLRARHALLEQLGRAQYDAQRPNYVSLAALANGNDATFCANVAHCSTSQLNKLLMRAM